MKTRYLFFLAAIFIIAGGVNAAGTALADTSLSFSRNLSIGMTGNDVSELQGFLITKGFLPSDDQTGYFGPLTWAAVAAWQASVGLPDTGYFGPLSRAMMATINTSTGTGTAVGTSTETGTSPIVGINTGIGIGTGTSTSASTTTTTGENTSSGSLNYNFGISLGESLLGLPSSTLNQELDTMAALGIGWIRFDMEWDHVQPTSADTYDWSQIDPVVAAINAHHMKILAILDYTPVWAESSTCASGSNFCAPSDPALFATFAKAAATRYAPEGVTDWEIWNEPNNSAFWGPTTDCAAYTALLKDSYTAIKSIEPNATVVTGGMSPAATDGTNMAPPDFLSCIYANGGGGYFDAVGDHPYTFPAMPSNDNGGAWDQMSATTPNLRSIMVAHGDADKKIWVTEFGTPTDGPDPNWYVSEAEQSAMVTDAFTTYENYSWGGPFFWYTFKDGGTSTDTNENFFGLLRADGSTKPAYLTLQALLLAGR